MMKDIDLLTRKVWIRCESSTCDAIDELDFAELIAPFRDMELLRRAYKAAPAATDGHRAVVNLGRLGEESVTVRSSTELNYSLSRINTP